MKIKVIDGEFCVCKVSDLSRVNMTDEFLFIGKTDEEISVVCKIESVPENAYTTDEGWNVFRIEGILDFSLIGILSKISTVLAENKIGIFAVSTYNTDYILVKKENFERACDALKENGYNLI